mgnify:CR=1 FL=1
MPDAYNPELIVDELDVVDIVPQWTFGAIIAKSQMGEYTVRAYLKYPI